MTDDQQMGVFLTLVLADKGGIPCATCDALLDSQVAVGAVSYQSPERVRAHCLECAKRLTPDDGWTIAIAASKTDRCWNHRCRFSCGWETVLPPIGVRSNAPDR